MKAVILAAGVGSSLYPLTKEQPKSLLVVNGHTLLERLITQMHRCGVTPIVVVGYKKNQMLEAIRSIQRHISLRIEVVDNPLYEKTNTLYSLWLARDHCRETAFLLVDGDLVCDDEVVETIFNDPRDSVLAVDRLRVMGAEEVKTALDARGLVAAVGKDLAPASAHAEFIGLSKYSASAGDHFLAIASEMVARGNRSAYYEEAISALAGLRPVGAADIAGSRWAEIDFIGDYIEALKMFHDDRGAQALSDIPSINQQMLFCPGPVLVSPAVRSALSAHEIGHREVEFSELLNRVRRKLGTVFGVKNFHKYTTVVLNGSGSAANEAVLGGAGVGRHLLILSNGEFGERLIRVARHLGLKFQALSQRWGQPFAPAMVESVLAGGGFDALVWVHHETSTGMLNPLRELAQLANRYRVDSYVDAVSSLGGVPIDVEKNGITFCTSSANKALGSVPGLSFVCGTREAFEALATVPSRSLYLDLYNHFTWNDRLYQTPNTPAVNLFFALETALDEILGDGIETRFSHYHALAEKLRDGFRRLGLRFFIPEEQMSPLLTTVELPPGFTADEFHDRLKRAEYIVYPGKGVLHDRVFQVANMGALTTGHIEGFLEALRHVLQGQHAQ